MTLTVWNALVLGLFGTAIARAVATDFCQQSGAGVVASVSYACRHWQSTLLATGLALAFPAGLRGLISLAGLLPELGSGGEWIAAAVWGIIFLLAVILALMFVVGGLAWLLSLAATGTDGCTGAEALSRCISYILSHPLWVAGAFTAITATGLAMRWVAELILAAGTAAMPAALLNLDSVMLTSGWLFVLRMIPHVFQLSVFLSGVTVCYVLLRQREDGIMIEEIDGAV